MINLLRANFSRMWKNKPFLLSAAIMLLTGITVPFTHFLNRDTEWTLDFSFFTYIFLASILTAVLTALFVGGEYSDGTLRNKLIAGHRRSSIYMANLIVCVTAGILLCVFHMIPHAVLGCLFSCRFNAEPKTILCYIGLSFMAIAAFTALFTLISMLCQSKSYTVAGCILLTVALLFWGVQITSALNEPEIFPAYTYVDTESGTTTEESTTRNPNYLTGTKRQIYKFLQDLTPGGQALQIADMNTDTPVQLTLFDGVILLVVTGCGLALFRRKDLK